MAAGVLSLNGTFTYPIELLKTLTVDEYATFKKSVIIGNECSSNDDNVCIVIGDANTFVHSDYSIAAGSGSKAYADYSVAIGENAQTGESTSENGKYSISLGKNTVSKHDYSFVFSGSDDGNIYESMAEGSVCFNPRYEDVNTPEYGFYIGSSCIPDLIDKYALEAVQENGNSFEELNTFNNGIKVESGNTTINAGIITVNSSVTTNLNGTTTVVTKQIDDNSTNAASTAYVKNNLENYLQLAGGTVTGSLILSGYPLVDNQSATKKYVDDNDEHITVSPSQYNGTTIATISNTTANGTTTNEIKIPDIIAGNHVRVEKSPDGGTITIDTDATIEVNGGTVRVPVGTIIPFIGDGTPSGFVLCDGSELDRDEYKELYDVIGTRYGGSDSKNTFIIPNLCDNRFLEGSTVKGTFNEAGIPVITAQSSVTNGLTVGTGGTHCHSITTLTSGALHWSTTGGTGAQFSTSYTSNAGSHSHNLTGNITVSTTLRDASGIMRSGVTTVQPKSFTVKFFIKYTKTTEEDVNKYAVYNTTTELQYINETTSIPSTGLYFTVTFDGILNIMVHSGKNDITKKIYFYIGENESGHLFYENDVSNGKYDSFNLNVMDGTKIFVKLEDDSEKTAPSMNVKLFHN